MVLDIGTGDGRFVYESARQDPTRFFIGIDANAKPLEKISMKATRRPGKGGLSNVLFVRAAVADLPAELNRTANEIHIHFPWGSLLGGVVVPDQHVLDVLKRVTAPGCRLEVIAGFEPARDRAELARLGLRDLSLEYLRTELAPKYEAKGFSLKQFGRLTPETWPHPQTTWARRLGTNKERLVVYFTAEARE